MNDAVVEEQVEDDIAEQFDEIGELVERGFTLKENSGEIVNFNANFFADFINRRMNILYTKDGFFHIYENGVWKKQEDQMMHKILRDILQEPRFGVWNRRYEDEYVAALKREVFYPKDMNPNRDIINLQNGVFDLKTLEFLPHDPKYLSTIQIPVMYDENAECPNFLKFLGEVFEEDAERIAVSQEWFGYAITMKTDAQKALILYGPGGNGKGVFVDILSIIIGEENISHIPLNELHRGFSRVSLYGKTANISNENESDGKSTNTQYFKAIVGGDPISAEQKNKPVFSFTPTAKLIMSMNHLPTTRDRSIGYYRRLMILCFLSYFGDEKRDLELKMKLKEELPGIFLWALEGHKRLSSNKHRFSKCHNMDDILAEYQKEQNPMIEFVEECTEKVEDQSYKEDNRVIHESFKSWAEKNGYSGYASMSIQKFWKELEAVAKVKGYNCKAGRSNDFRYHTGIKILPQYRVEAKIRSRVLKNRKSNEELLLE